MHERHNSSRRRFIRSMMAGALVATPPPVKSRVVVAHEPKLRPAGSGVDSTRLLAMLDRTMQALCGTDSSVEAWKKMVRPGEVIGLKVNCLAGRGISTSLPLVEAVCERLREAGIPAKDIIIWDRLNADLDSAGFRISTQQGTIRTLGNDVFGYEEELAVHGSVGSLLCKTLTRACDAVINLPVLKDHGIVGVTMAMKNMFGAIHNPNKYHMEAGNPYVADVCMLEPIRRKLRFTLCDATTAQYEGGPSFMPQWSWRCDGLLASRDPVALDFVGWQMIETRRADKGMRSLTDAGRAPLYIATAADARHRLGTDDPKLIERIDV
jgi:uncharacterized protein (DUF362 family)